MLIRISAKNAFAYIAALILMASLLAAASPSGRTAFLTLSFLPEVLPNAPIRPLRWVTADPVRQPVEYPNATGYGKADLYLPGEGTEHGAILLFLGVNPAGRDDPRVVGLGNALARAGVVTMIPWSDSMTQRRIAVGEIDNLVFAYQYLLQHARVDPERAGMAGFCVGASLAMVAAQDARISKDVRFINFFGGYFDGTDLIASVAASTRYYPSIDHLDNQGETQPWSPNELTRQVVAAQLIEGVASQQERQVLTELYRGSFPNIKADVDSFSPGARSVYGLLSGPKLADVPALIDGLPAGTLASLRSISPSTRIGDLKARVLIMHDRQDDLVPSEESRRLADSLGPDQVIRYTEFAFFQHVDPTRPVGPLTFLREGAKLYWHLYAVFQEVS